MPVSESSPYLGADLPRPLSTPLDAPYWEGTLAGKLMVQRCAACQTAEWPPEEICRNCGSTDREWVAASGRGTIHTWTRVWHPVHPALAGRCPYLVVVVRLEDFPVLMVGNLLGPEDQSVDIGMPVEVAFEPHPEGYALAQWRRTH